MSESTYSTLEQQVIALAGVAQAARLVDQISKTGSYPVEFLEPSVHSLFEFEPENVEDVFGGIAGVRFRRAWDVAQLVEHRFLVP